MKWLAGKVEAAGITIFTGFAGSELLYDGDRVTGVRTDDKGVDKQNQRKSNFEPGYDVKACPLSAVANLSCYWAICGEAVAAAR